MEVFIKGVSVLIDDEDYELFSEYKWGIRNGYLSRSNRTKNKCFTIYFHREILGLTDQNMITDHINRNKLDNRRCNLRVCSKKENGQNKSVRKNTSSKYIGVFKKKGRKKYISSICGTWIGTFENEDEAALAYNKEAIKRFGEFANLNRIELPILL